jgi:hypothetical protein
MNCAEPLPSALIARVFWRSIDQIEIGAQNPTGARILNRLDGGVLKNPLKIDKTLSHSRSIISS